MNIGHGDKRAKRMSNSEVTEMDKIAHMPMDSNKHGSSYQTRLQGFCKVGS